MEKYSRWRDPSTGLQPFLPQAAERVSPIFAIVLLPFSAAHSFGRTLVLSVVALLHILLVDGVLLLLSPVGPLHRLVSGYVTAFTCRLALALMGYWWIDTEDVSPKRGKQGIAQSTRAPGRGDLIISNWTSYVDVLYLAFRHNPTFLLPVFAPLEDLPVTEKGKTGRHTGTGSAQIASVQSLPQPPLLGYMPIPLLGLLARTGSLPPNLPVPPQGMYKTLREARRKEAKVVCLLPEGTTGNGRAVLRFGEGLLAEGDTGGEDEGIVWITYMKHSPPLPFAPAAACPLPRPLHHLVFEQLWTPHPAPKRSLLVRTLHPSASPSSPSFLPSEILAGAPGGLDNAGRDGKAAWREAIATVLAETGKVRRVKGMGWVEKAAFLEYWASNKRT